MGKVAARSKVDEEMLRWRTPHPVAGLGRCPLPPG